MSLLTGDEPTVLVVDDSDDIRELMRVQLRRKGCRVVEAADGREAVELAPRVRPDLILMDLSMPVLDGYEATRQIRADPLLRAVPIVAVSAHCDGDGRYKALAAGCVECVPKPFDLGSLNGLLQRHLRAL